MNRATKKVIKVVLIIVGVLIIIRLVLPYIILHFANKELSSLDNYYGHIDDIDLSIFNGFFKIEDVYINSVDSATGKQTPFFDSEEINFWVSWENVFKGKVVGEVSVLSPSIYFAKDKVEPEEVERDTTDIRRIVKQVIPIRVNRFEVKQGKVQYVDETIKPTVKIFMTDIHVLVKNLTNIDNNALLPSSAEASANVYGGTLEFNMKFDPLATPPNLDLNAKVTSINLAQLNKFFKAYGNFDVNKGTLGLYTEVAVKSGKYEGYVKPIVKNLDVKGPEDRKEAFFDKLWEGTIDVVTDVFENPKKDQVATKIPLQGTLKNADADIWYTVLYLLRNAFVQALRPSIDYEINIRSVDATPPKKEEKKGFFKRLFGKDDDKKKDKNKKK